jgi:glycosyltransferase involved in cell wall biosynthesis
MPSQGEGFGLVYLEAMRLGRPCLVSTCDAGREVVAPPTAGLAVDAKDEAALVEATMSLLSFCDHRPEWSDAARQRYETQFTATHFQERLLSALKSACST